MEGRTASYCKSMKQIDNVSSNIFGIRLLSNYMDDLMVCGYDTSTTLVKEILSELFLLPSM